MILEMMPGKQSAEKTFPVIEIFRSIQGEGLWAGQSHLFLRFDKCNIDCHYCDELKKPSRPWTLAAIHNAIEALLTEEAGQPFLSFTGGEPLLYPKAILEVCRHFGDRLRYYLETNGNLPKPLAQVVSSMDVIAMDIKLESISHTQNTFDANEAFLRICREQNKEVFVKIVVGEAIDFNEWDEAVAVIEKVTPKIPLVIQPLTLKGESVSIETLMRLQQRASRHLADVRIIPRLHEIFQIP